MAAQICSFDGVEPITHSLFRQKVYCKCDTGSNLWVNAIIGDEIHSPINGRVICVDTVPGATAPTNAYDLELLNAEAIDIMGGSLTDRSNAASERAYPITIIGQSTFVVVAPVDGALTITMANNAVNGADWTMYIYFQKEETARG